MRFNKLILALLLTAIHPLAFAMSMGSGQIISHIGERFSANITLVGRYNPGVEFFQVREAECRSSIMGSSSNTCDSIYEGKLSFNIRTRPDGQYLLRVSGDVKDDFFYRIMIRSSSIAGEAVYKLYEFLPEFIANPDSPTEVDDSVPVLSTAGKLGVVADRTPASDIKKVQPAKVVPLKLTHGQMIRPETDAIKKNQEAKLPVAKTTDRSSLKITKSAEYADDIHALQKENTEIKAQIGQLEKHIGLLKEVIRLKNQTADSAVPQTVVAVHSAVQLKPRPPLQAPPAFSLRAYLDSSVYFLPALLAAVIMLCVAAGVMFIRRKKLKSNLVDHKISVGRPSSTNELKSLDLTGAFVKPKW